MGEASVQRAVAPGVAGLLPRLGPEGHYRALSATPGRLLLDRCLLSELADGPLHPRRSRLT